MTAFCMTRPSLMSRNFGAGAVLSLSLMFFRDTLLRLFSSNTTAAAAGIDRLRIMSDSYAFSRL